MARALAAGMLNVPALPLSGIWRGSLSVDRGELRRFRACYSAPKITTAAIIPKNSTKLTTRKAGNSWPGN
jgi:hypothetical protein